MRDRAPALLVAYIIGTFTLAFILAVMPVTGTWHALRPNLVVMVLIFWLLNNPRAIDIGSACLIGLLFDALCGGVLGQEALSFTIVAYLVLLLHHRIQLFGTVLQTVLIFGLLELDQLIAIWVHVIMRGGSVVVYGVLNALTGALCWPLLQTAMNRYRRVFAGI